MFNMMNDTSWMNGLMGGGMWLWTIIIVLMVLLLVWIFKVSNK